MKNIKDYFGTKTATLQELAEKLGVDEIQLK